MLNRIKGFIIWTKNVIEIYFGNLRQATSNKTTYWDCRQTFFATKEDREIYHKREEELIKELKIKLNCGVKE